jgi:hypothetical protein
MARDFFRVAGNCVMYADSDEENRSFRAEDDQSIAERRWQSYCAAGDRHESRKRFEI